MRPFFVYIRFKHGCDSNTDLRNHFFKESAAEISFVLNVPMVMHQEVLFINSSDFHFLISRSNSSCKFVRPMRKEIKETLKRKIQFRCCAKNSHTSARTEGCRISRGKWF